MSESILKKSLDIINKDCELKSKKFKETKSSKFDKLRMKKRSNQDKEQMDKLKFKKSISLIEEFKSRPEKRKLKLEENKRKLKQMASIKVDKSFSKVLFKDFKEDTKEDKKSKGSVFTEDDFLEFEKQFCMN